MEPVEYGKYKISLKPKSDKTQGLRTGDIVRRQFFDGTSVVYTLMCVLEAGSELVDVVTGETVDGTQIVGKQENRYFVGALLAGDEPKQGEVLDFARVTNLFDTDRSGALYLTASDDQAPYMDVIDGIGRNCSLCWPESLERVSDSDPCAQYIVQGGSALASKYAEEDGERKRVLTISKNSSDTFGFTGLKQEIYDYVKSPEQIIISGWFKSSQPVELGASLCYAADKTVTEPDASWSVDFTTEWRYAVWVVPIVNSGRHHRAFKLDLGRLAEGESVSIADFNVIRLSSLDNFNEASRIRIGKLNGITDPVFGRLEGYGGYLQNLVATSSAHVSGTLTAGDENGFASTFYAGKIHKNAFVNSIAPETPTEAATDTQSPTGIGNVYPVTNGLTMAVQSFSWARKHSGQKHCFSCWVKSGSAVNVEVKQNNVKICDWFISEGEAGVWQRFHVAYKLVPPGLGADYMLSIGCEGGFNGTALASSFQLESGAAPTQYQPTDETLDYTEGYGAWFSRGGIAGTIQNPLLRLNSDGSIASRSDTFRINNDGSGHIAKNKIRWQPDGTVIFDPSVKLKWENFADDAKDNVIDKYVKIIGSDTFTLMGDNTGAEPVTDPSSIVLQADEHGMEADAPVRNWAYLKEGVWVDFPASQNGGNSIEVYPYNENPDYWGDSNQLTVKYTAAVGSGSYADSVTIRKSYITGYTVVITSTKGYSYKNHDCQTVLTANVYYQGKLVDPAYVTSHFGFRWSKYHYPDLTNEEAGWKDGLKTDGRTLTLVYDIDGSDYFTCELLSLEGFVYDFPIYF